MSLKQENWQLKRKLLKTTSSVARMEGNDDETRFFTGLPSYAVFTSLLNLLSAIVPTTLTGCGLPAGDHTCFDEIKIGCSKPRSGILV